MGEIPKRKFLNFLWLVIRKPRPRHIVAAIYDGMDVRDGKRTLKGMDWDHSADCYYIRVYN